MRISYSDEEDYPGQFDLWQANCERSIRGHAGQHELRELRAALLGLSDKRLIVDALEDEQGGVCAIGAYAKRKGLDLSKFDVDFETDQVVVEAGMPPLVAWKVVEMNDLILDQYNYTPERRYANMLTWIEKELAPQDSANLIPEDEPVFLIRGQDRVGHAAVRAWAHLHRVNGGSNEAYELAMRHADEMEAWTRERACKCADVPPGV